MADSDLPRDHWVSRGYQRNFATPDQRVAIFDVRLGRVVDPQRPIKSNFRERGFTTFLEAGVPNNLLERAFASVESRLLNEIRTIGNKRSEPQQKADVANLFAVHLVRSPAFKAFHAHISTLYRGVRSHRSPPTPLLLSVSKPRKADRRTKESCSISRFASTTSS